MSYYDHAILMYLKQGPWDPDPLKHEKRYAIARRRGYKSHHRARGTISLLVVAAGLLVLGVTGLSA